MSAKLSPEKSLRLAAELIKHAMSDFREPNRVPPSEEISAARREVIDWLFRRHTYGDEHLVPLSEFLEIVEYIEKSKQSTIRSAKVFSDPLMTKDAEQREWWIAQGSAARSTLAAMARLRQHYDAMGRDPSEQDESVVVAFDQGQRG